MDIQAIKEFAKAIRRTAVQMAYNTRTSHTGGTMSQAAVLACGNILDASRQQIEDESLPYDLYSVPFVKPINMEQLKTIVESHPDGLVTIEEHQKSCGMGSAVVEILNDMFANGKLSVYPKIKRIAIPDEFVGVVGTQKYLREVENLHL